MFYYAYLNSEDIVEQIITLPSTISVSQYIQISSYDETLIGKKYNRTTGEFEKVITYAEVTTEDAMFWSGTPVATISQTYKKTVSGANTVVATIPFDTKRSGYMPRRIYMQFKHPVNSNEIRDNVVVVFERDEDNTIRFKTTYRDGDGALCNGYVDRYDKSKVFEYTKKKKSTVDSSGGCCFVSLTNDFTSETAMYDIRIGKWTFDEKSVSFTYTIPADFTSATLQYDVRGYVY